VRTVVRAKRILVVYSPMPCSFPNASLHEILALYELRTFQVNVLKKNNTRNQI